MFFLVMPTWASTSLIFTGCSPFVPPMYTFHQGEGQDFFAFFSKKEALHPVEASALFFFIPIAVIHEMADQSAQQSGNGVDDPTPAPADGVAVIVDQGHPAKADG